MQVSVSPSASPRARDKFREIIAKVFILNLEKFRKISLNLILIVIFHI